MYKKHNYFIDHKSIKYNFRTISKEDIEFLRVTKNNNKIFFFHTSEITSDEQINWFLEYNLRKDDFMFVIEKDNNLIGCMGIRLKNGNWDVYNIILGDMQYKGNGIMSKCFQKLISFANEFNPVPIKLNVLLKNPAVNWYIKQGFKVISKQDIFYEMIFINN
jgi:hypothetical protein